MHKYIYTKCFVEYDSTIVNLAQTRLTLKPNTASGAPPFTSASKNSIIFLRFSRTDDSCFCRDTVGSLPVGRPIESRAQVRQIVSSRAPADEIPSPSTIWPQVTWYQAWHLSQRTIVSSRVTPSQPPMARSSAQRLEGRKEGRKREGHHSMFWAQVDQKSMTHQRLWYRIRWYLS